MRSRLREALEAAGAEAFVREVPVATAEEAEAAGMPGSPTIMIDGHDPFAAKGQAASLSCRLYASGGRIDTAPTVSELVESLSG